MLWLVFLQLSLCVFTCRAQSSFQDGALPWYIWLIIALALSVAIILITASIFYIVYNCRRLCSNQPSSPRRHHREDRLQLVEKGVREEVDTNLDAPGSGVDWELPRNKVKVIQQLGIGEFGPIYDAEVRLEANVVSRALVKVFSQGTSQDLVRFRDDIAALMRFNHPHVARLFGMVSQVPYYVVLELTVNGDLKTFLISSSSSSAESHKPFLSTSQLVAMATDVASGLAYLESLRYVHKDIAARNCIVTQTLGVKVTDFKIGRYLFRSEYAVQTDGSLMPLRWMAPESIMQNVFNLSTNVWSFGILLWEVASQGSFPYMELSDAEVVGAVCQQQHSLLQPLDCPDNVYQIMLRCWNQDAKKRPRMAAIHKLLESSILTNHYAPS